MFENLQEVLNEIQILTKMETSFLVFKQNLISTYNYSKKPEKQ